jgi:drug/metabolite transporter (DMT)-like permease
VSNPSWTSAAEDVPGLLPSAFPAPARPLLGGSFLLVAAALWGVGFYAQRLSLAVLPPLTATALRFALALPVIVVSLFWSRRRGALPWAPGLVLGGLMYVVFALQAVALLHTPVTRVALLTGLYAVFTPLLQPLFGLRRPAPMQVVAAGCACLATALLCGAFGDAEALSAEANLGDALTLAVAVLSALCVLVIARVAPGHDPVALNGVQILVTALLALFVAPLFEPLTPLTSLPMATWWSLLYLALFSTIVAFLLQLLGQRQLSPTPATTIMLLESPIAVVAAVLLLGEVMAGLQWLGAGLAVFAVALALFGERRA